MNLKRTAIFIDMANISYAFGMIKEKDTDRIDFIKLVQAISRGTDIVINNVYQGINPESTNPDGQQRFLDFFRDNGFKVYSKDFKKISTGEGTKIKANFDVEIAIDVASCLWRRDADEIILISGDSDFKALALMAKNFGVEFTVVSTNQTIARELREIATRIILLDELHPSTFMF